MPQPGTPLAKLGFLTIGLFNGDDPGPGHQAGFREVTEVAFALPFTFEHEDYVQILTDMANVLGPALGWKPAFPGYPPTPPDPLPAELPAIESHQPHPFPLHTGARDKQPHIAQNSAAQWAEFRFARFRMVAMPAALRHAVPDPP